VRQDRSDNPPAGLVGDHLALAVSAVVLMTVRTLARLTGMRRRGGQVMNMPVNKKASPSTTHTMPIDLGDQ
jgi:hypothetical protein